MAYSVLLKPRREVLSGEGIDGIIDLANLLSSRRKALERDATRFFELTWPTADIRRVIGELDKRFSTDQPTPGLFLFEGLKGTGKSHLLLLIYHLFNSRTEASKWLARHGLQCRLPTDAVVVINKFTDLPLASIWDFIYAKLGLPLSGKTLVHPNLKSMEDALAGRRLVLIFDEIEQGIRVISEPAIRDQNVAFLQMLSEWGNRSNQVTLFASIYSSAEEPGQTLKRVPSCRIQFSQFEDRERVVLHRLFENAERLDRSAAASVVSSYVNVWRRHGTVPENFEARFCNSYPFSPELTELLLKRVPARGGFQGVRGALGFLANLVRLTHQTTDIISPGHASLEDQEVRTRLADLEPSGDLIERARTDAANVSGKFPLARDIAAAAFLYTVSSPVGSKQTGATSEELQRSVLGLGTDINDFNQALRALEKYGAHFHSREGRYYFDPEEQPDAKVEFKSLNVSETKARELLREIWLRELFRDDGSGVVFSDVQRTREALEGLPKDRLRFVIAPRRLSKEERHELFDGLELRNQVVLLEPKDSAFDLDRNADLVKWAQRQIAAQELAMFADDAQRRDTYEKIQRQDKAACIKAIQRAGLVYVHWQSFGPSASQDQIEEESVPGREQNREEVLRFLQNNLFPEQVFIDHLIRRREDLMGKPVRMIERDYQQVLGYPVPIGPIVLRALERMCSESRIGVQHARDNACGRKPNLKDSELREATVVAPFPEAAPPPRPPIPTPVPPGPGEPPGPLPPPAPTEQWRDIRCLPKNTPGELRIELASRLAEANSNRVRYIVFKIFFQESTGDLSSLPASLRGNLKGPGSLTAEVQIRKEGDFSKAEVEQMAELLPSISGAKYEASLKVIVTEIQSTHV